MAVLMPAIGHMVLSERRIDFPEEFCYFFLEDARQSWMAGLSGIFLFFRPAKNRAHSGTEAISCAF